nr:unnamed protein product [Spirometra erinaceieuropaei]
MDVRLQNLLPAHQSFFFAGKADDVPRPLETTGRDVINLDGRPAADGSDIIGDILPRPRQADDAAAKRALSVKET